MKKLTTQEFIQKAKQVHGDKYDYTSSNYVNSRTKVKVGCRIHGEFFQKASNHLQGATCYACGLEVRGKSKTEGSRQIFESKAKKIHGDRYDYSQVLYLGSESKVTIVCPSHDRFLQLPSSHLQGYGCPDCANSEKYGGWRYGEWKSSAEKSKHFDSFKIYVLRCFNTEENFYKIGRTYNEVKFRTLKIPYNTSLIYQIEHKNARIICDLENELKCKYKSYKYIPKLSFGGRQECFNTNLPIQEIVEMYSNIFEGSKYVFNHELYLETGECGEPQKLDISRLPNLS